MIYSIVYKAIKLVYDAACALCTFYKGRLHLQSGAAQLSANDKGAAMPHNFFVTGLPRSRTAWFAAYLDCKHEPMNGASSDAELIEIIGDGGASDCGLAWFNIRKHYPNSPVLVIDRDINDVITSMNRILPINNEVIHLLQETRAKMLSIEGALIIKYDQINDKLEEIWNFLKGGKFDGDRADMFKGLNIQLSSYSGDKDSFDFFLRRA